jgi:hypothetical protein
MTTHTQLVVLTERNVLKDMSENLPLPVHFIVKCETKMGAHVLAATLAANDYTIISESQSPLEIECVGRRISQPPPGVL